MSDLESRRHERFGNVRLREAPGRVLGGLAQMKRDLAVWSDVRAFPALAILAGLDCVASLVLISDRASRTSFKLGDSRLCLAAIAAAALAIGSRWSLARIERERPALWIRSALAAFSVFPLIALLTTATSRNSPWAISLVSALAVAAGNANLLWSRNAAARAMSIISPDIAPPERPAGNQPVLLPAVAAPPAEPLGADRQSFEARRGEREVPEWLERVTGETGDVTLRGQIVADFAPGQSVATVHVSFNPPFARLPEFSHEVFGAPAIRSRAPAVYHYGVRVELKRNGDTSTAARAEIRFVARAPSHSSRAA